MGCEPILPNIQPVTIDTMLNRISGDIKNEKIGLNFVTCEQSLYADAQCKRGLTLKISRTLEVPS